MNNKGRWIKIVVISTVIAVALGSGITFSKFFFTPGANQLLAKAELSYAKGMETLNHGDAGTAAARFEEANLQANKTLDAVAKEKQKAGEQAAAGLEQVEGKTLWLKMKSLRDLFLARGISENKPLPQAVDTINGTKFYPVLAIPDDQSRQEAFTCLREAARRLTREADVQRLALLTELMLPVPDWNIIEKTARQALQINAEDPWPLYLLARFDFEQPTSTGRRNRQRVLQARKYVTQLKDTGSYPLWRTLYLEAQITQWLIDSAPESDSTRRENEEKTLRTLLFAPKGALACAAAGEGLEHPGKWDIEGILGLHQMALTLAVEDSRQPKAPADKVVELLNRTLKLSRQLAEKEAGYVPLCALSAVQALARAEPVLLSVPPADWKQDLSTAQELVRKARDQKVSNPLLYETIAGLLTRESFIEGKRGNKERRDELNSEALQWLEDGLRLATEAKLPADQLLGLNAGAAELLTVSGTRPEKVRGYLTALRESKSSRAQAMANLLEASTAEREGRLVQARKLLEQVVASGDADFTVRANMVLGVVYLASGQPDKALVSLQQVVQAYKVYDNLTPQDKAWALEFIRSPEDLALLQVRAHVDSALAQLRITAQRSPGKPVSLETVRRHETAIAELRKRFQKETPQDRQAREIVAAFYSATQRRDLAARELSELRSIYPNSVDVLRTEVELQPSARDAEKRIDQYIKDHPTDLDARFFKVEWLTRMKRVDDALAYLQSPTNFTDTKSERYQRVLAAILLTKGDRQGGQKVLEQLPHDAATDALLIQSASAGDREKLLKEALARHEDNALIQSWQAVTAFNKGDYPTAAEAFLRASQFNRYEETARRGLLQSLLGLTQADPVKALELAARLRKEAPEEPALFLASAYANIQLDEIGTPGDKPDPAKSMCAALNAWEQLLLQQPQRKASAPLTKSAFWGLAGRQDLALSEAVRALSINPNDTAALGQTISLALELRDPNLRSVTRKRLDTLRKLLPDNTNALLLEARFDEWSDQPKDALVIYKDLLAKDAKLSEAYARMIPLLIKQGDKEKAREYVKRWRKAQPDNIAAAQAEIRLLCENKQPAQARKLAESLVNSLEEQAKTKSEQSRLNLQLKMIAGLVQGKAWSEAEDWLTQLLAKSPDDAAILIRLGDVYVAQSAWEKARAIYKKILTKNKSNAAAANNLAWLLVKHFDNPGEALRLVQEARKGAYSQKPISPERLRPEFLDTLGLIYTKLGNAALYPEMRDLFEAARQRYPHDPRMYMYLGNAYAGLLETDRAERLYASAVDVAQKSGREFLTSEKCDEVISEVKAAQKKLKETAQR